MHQRWDTQYTWNWKVVWIGNKNNTADKLSGKIESALHLYAHYTITR